MSPLALSLRFLQAQPDIRLVELAGQGHEAAFEALVRRYRNELLSYCRRVTSEPTSAEDALQQALLQAWKALNGGAQVREVKGWLYRIAHNVAISHLRAADATPHEIEDTPASLDLDQLVQERLRARAVLAGMATLPDLQRQVFLSTTLDGASHEEVASELGLTSGSVRGLIYRARTALRAAAAAVIPSPLLSWAIRHAAMRSKRTHAVVEAVVGGGGAGMAGLIAKGGAVIAITGAVAGGGMIVSSTLSHRPNGEIRRAELHRAGDSSIYESSPGRNPGNQGEHASPSVPGARGTSDTHSGRGGGTGSTPGSAGASTSREDGSSGGSDGGSSGESDGGSSGGSHGGSPGGSDGGSPGGSDGGSRGDSSLTTVAQQSGGTPGGSEGSAGSGGSGSSGGGVSGTAGPDGGSSGTSSGQVTTAAITSGTTSGSDGRSSASSGSGDTSTTPH